MKLSPKSLTACAKVVSGDVASPLYRSGPKLVEFFNQFGNHEEYPWEGGFPTRWFYAKEKLETLNNTDMLRKALCAALDPRDFIEFGGNSSAVEHLNQYLSFDGYEICCDGKRVWIQDLNGVKVNFEPPLEAKAGANAAFIEEQIEKCERKILQEDYTGAITNARSMVEAVLVQIEGELDGQALDYDGDLPKLYKRVQKLLNLSPGRTDISDSLKQILSGLSSVVQGLGSLRNKTSDSHVTNYRPEKHHATLAVNAAKTLSDFLFSTRSYQDQRK